MRYGLLFLLCWWPLQSHALTWEDWWQTPDQQAARQLAQGEAQAAAETFHDPAWQAIADYRAGNYAQAAKAFAQENTAVGHFNQGNALVHAGDYPSALAAYQQALTLQPDFADAQFNLARLKELSLIHI